MKARGQLFVRGSQSSNFGGKRHGMTWTRDEMNSLHAQFFTGKGWRELCQVMERPLAGIIPKLLKMELIRSEDGDYVYNVDVEADDLNRLRVKIETVYGENSPENQGEPEMALQSQVTSTVTHKNIEQVTLIRGRNATTMTDDQIFSLIGELEGEVESLGKIKNKPRKLTERIEALQKDIDALVKYVDSRE